ncbi:MAG: DUF4097 family beta strand repeat-containing protein [Phycisphaerales bacterium JB039]
MKLLGMACAAIALGVGLSGCVVEAGAWRQQAAHQELRAWSAPIEPDRPVIVESENGSITLLPCEGEQFIIAATVRATTLERLAAVDVRADRQADGGLRIWAEWPDQRQPDEGVSFDIALPSASSITAITANGTIELTGLRGPARLESSNGAIKVQGHEGAVDASTSNGAITIEGATADVTADTSNGKVTIVHASGAGGSVRARSSNGRIHVQLGAGFSGRITCRTSNGSISLPKGESMILLQDGRNLRSIQLGEGDAVVDLHTSNGPISVQR